MKISLQPWWTLWGVSTAVSAVLAVGVGCRSWESNPNTVPQFIRPLAAPGLGSWEKPHGEWQAVGQAVLDPGDETRLASEPGEGVLVNGAAGRTVNLLTQEDHGDVVAHLEFLVPKGSNSGVYFQGRYEIQILDSWGVLNPTFSDCGGIYQRWVNGNGSGGHAPRFNASLPPGEWQSFDVVFRAPRFDNQGRKIENARFVKVVHNGIVIHENVVLEGPTRAAAFEDERRMGPLMLQGDHGPVAFRKIVLRQLVIP